MTSEWEEGPTLTEQRYRNTKTPGEHTETSADHAISEIFSQAAEGDLRRKKTKTCIGVIILTGLSAHLGFSFISDLPSFTFAALAKNADTLIIDGLIIASCYKTAKSLLQKWKSAKSALTNDPRKYPLSDRAYINACRRADKAILDATRHPPHARTA